MSLEQKSKDRKARLKAMSNKLEESAEQESVGKKRKLCGDEINTRTSPKKETEKELRFRAYEPQSSELKAFIKKAPAIGLEANETQDTVEKRVEKIQKDVEIAESLKSKELDLTTLAPKKPNFDLKRHLDKKLDILDKKTTNAIGDLIRERLKAKKVLV